MKKICSKCKVEKDVTEFYRNVLTKDNLQSSCKECCGKANKKSRQTGLLKKRIFVEEKVCNVCKVLKNRNEYYGWKYSKDGLRDLCIPCINYANKEYESKESSKEKRRVRWRKYYNSNLEFRIRVNISRSVRRILKSQDYRKLYSILKYLPYSLNQLKLHLEKQFDENMNWENYGSYWWIDHIIPQTKLLYDSMEHPNFQKCWALENLRPLEKIENIKKGNK